VRLCGLLQSSPIRRGRSPQARGTWSSSAPNSGIPRTSEANADPDGHEQFRCSARRHHATAWASFIGRVAQGDGAEGAGTDG
jgi:hypothetical protein